MNNQVMSFGENLKYHRKKQKLSQKKLASLIGVGQTTIANYENDLRFPNSQLLNSLADHLDISLDELMGRRLDSSQSTTIEEHSIDHFLDLILEGQDNEAKDYVISLAKQGVDVIELYHSFLKEILYKVGSMWEAGQLSIPMEHHISHIVDQLLILLSPYISCKKYNGKSALFLAPSNEPHLLGLKIIKETFKKYGWRTLYIGNSVPWSSLRDYILESQADLVVISTTMINNTNELEALVNYIRENTQARVMLGGQAYHSNKFILDQIKPDYFANTKDDLYDLLETL